MDPERVLKRIQNLVRQQKYRARIHASTHMIEEGFEESDLEEALTRKARILEHYPDEERCLILGYYLVDSVEMPLHVVCDYSKSTSLDIITAYTPQKPWWVTPTRRAKKR